jgi:hypothetical protein
MWLACHTVHGPAMRRRRPDSPTTPADPVARLRELVDLRKQGFLTEEEFAAQKALVLGQPQVLPAEPGRAPGGTGDQ